MVDQIERARVAVQRAADVVDNATVHKQLLSVDEGLHEMTHDDKTEGDVPHGDDLEELEMKLAGLADEVDGDAQSLIQDARNDLDGYRREYTRDWSSTSGE